MKLVNLVKSEFKKNFSLKKLIFSFLVLLLFCFLLLKLTDSEEQSAKNYTLFYAEHLASQKQIEKMKQEAEKDFQSRYSLIMVETRVELLNELKDSKIPASRWNLNAVFEVSNIAGNNFLIEKLKNKEKDVMELCEDSNSDSYLREQISGYCDSSTSELEDVYNNNEVIINTYEKILLENKFYQYIQYEVELGKREKNKFTDLIIEKKIEKEDYFVFNYYSYNSVNSVRADRIEETNKEFYQKIDKDNNQIKEILFYSSKYKIKHDLSYNEFNGFLDFLQYDNSKKVVNQVYHLSFVIMLLISIMYGGIVSNEHTKGTIKNMISAPVRRWKILASKFIYLVLNTYFLWFIGLVILSIIAGMKFGFSDLFTPKLIYTSGKVIEVNYYLYTIKNIFLASIPVICFLSILFMLSTVTLNTSLTVGVTSSISVLSPVLFLFLFNNHFKEIVYTPFWYFDLGFILNNDFHYLESLMKNFYHWEYGIIISLVIGIIIYVLTTLIYMKRDIKN